MIYAIIAVLIVMLQSGVVGYALRESDLTGGAQIVMGILNACVLGAIFYLGSLAGGILS